MAIIIIAMTIPKQGISVLQADIQFEITLLYLQDDIMLIMGIQSAESCQ